MSAMTTPRSRSMECTRHVVFIGAGPPLEDPASNSDLVPAVIKFARSFPKSNQAALGHAAVRYRERYRTNVLDEMAPICAREFIPGRQTGGNYLWRGGRNARQVEQM